MSTVRSCMFPDFPAADARCHRAAMIEALESIVDGGNFVLGSEVVRFEQEFASFLGIRHFIGLASGTDAIELLLRTLEIGPGDAVALPALAPSAVAAAVARCGARIVLVDVEDGMLTMCPNSLKTVLESTTGLGVKAVLAVHLFGQPAAWSELQAVCSDRGVFLLEDGAQAHGARWKGRAVGTLGLAAAWSFYPTKNLGALGDAGGVSTDDDGLAARLREMREYGWKRRHVSDSTGFNSRLDEVQAAFLRVKLPDLVTQIEKRMQRAARYTQKLEGVRVPVVREGCRHAWHQFVVRHSNRDSLVQHLLTHGVPVAVHYPVALHQQPAFACAMTFRMAERAVAEVMSLPVHPYLPLEAIDAVCAAISTWRP